MGREIFELVSGIGARAPHRINLVLRSVLSAKVRIRSPSIVAVRPGSRCSARCSPWVRYIGSRLPQPAVTEAGTSRAKASSSRGMSGPAGW